MHGRATEKREREKNKMTTKMDHRGRGKKEVTTQKAIGR